MAGNSILGRLALIISANTAEFGKAMTANSSALNKFAKTAESVSNQIKNALGLISFGVVAKQLIDVTSEFEKFEALLTNTLGSNSEAQKALTNIRKFALSTPFEVSEVTAAYVRWANQGLNPNIKKMQQLGDVASSLGAGFEQTAEAFKDLMVGQTKRIEEVGISAAQANGKIQLSFKGVNLEIEKNAEGVQKALETYSQLNGVLGTSDAVAQTLGGKISNLSDAWNNFLVTVGEGNKGVLFDAVGSLTAIVNAAANVSEELELKAAVYGLKSFNDLSDKTLDYLLAFGKTNAGNAVADVIKPLNDLSNADFFDDPTKSLTEFVKLLTAEGETIEDIRVLWGRYIQTRVEASNADVEAEKKARFDAVEKAKRQAKEFFDLVNSRGLIETINARIEELEIKKKKAFSVSEIQAFNIEIQSLKEQLDALNETKSLSNFGKKQLENAKAGIKTDVTIPTTEDPKLFENLFPDDTDVKSRGQAMIDTIEEVMKARQLSSDQLISLAEIQKDLDDEERKREEAKADMARYVGTVIGDALGDAISSQKSALQATKQVLSKLLPLFLSMALAGTIAGAGKTTAPPPVIVALAAAGVAAVSALFSKATGHSGGGGGGASIGRQTGTNVQRLSAVPAFGESVKFDATFHIKGQDLEAISNSQNNRNKRLG